LAFRMVFHRLSFRFVKYRVYIGCIPFCCRSNMNCGQEVKQSAEIVFFYPISSLILSRMSPIILGTTKTEDLTLISEFSIIIFYTELLRRHGGRSKTKLPSRPTDMIVLNYLLVFFSMLRYQNHQLNTTVI
ncbi:hypothetical protein L9F63_018213, partial [Diploptera punctata]